MVTNSALLIENSGKVYERIIFVFFSQNYLTSRYIEAFDAVIGDLILLEY